MPNVQYQEELIEDFRSGDLHKVARRIRFLQGTTYHFFDGRPQPQTFLHCMDDGNPEDSHWAGMDEAQRSHVLDRYVDWTGFSPPQADRIIANVAAGAPALGWFEGVDPGWRGIGERALREWAAYESLPPIEQYRHQVKGLMKSSTLEGDHTVAMVRWERMTDDQRRESLTHQIDHRKGVILPHAEREAILREAMESPHIPATRVVKVSSPDAEPTRHKPLTP